jgi:mevalonate kinase
LTKKFYSNGKLLLTGEYLVLDGAKAFALPTKMGQDLLVTQTNEANTIHWKSCDFDQSVWFETTLSTLNITAKPFISEEDEVIKVLTKILFEAHQLNPAILPDKGFSVETHLTFPRFWGLGTSSTLINNVAQWFEINAFELLKNSFGGSGYDIANAQNNGPITYQLINGNPIVERIEFHPTYAEHIYFLYLNQKQNSKTAIAMYYSKSNDIQECSIKINAISQEIADGVDRERFEFLLNRHETLMSSVLEMATVKERYFSDFEGTIKSLGAWGGDFVMVVSTTNPKDYFESKGFSTLLHYREMIL